MFHKINSPWDVPATIYGLRCEGKCAAQGIRGSKRRSMGRRPDGRTLTVKTSMRSTESQMDNTKNADGFHYLIGVRRLIVSSTARWGRAAVRRERPGKRTLRGPSLARE